MSHVPPPSHPAFYCSAHATLTLTRPATAEMGYCPSARLFEAAACGVPLISDEWLGLERFFEPEREIVVVRSTEDVVAALERAPVELAKMASRARARVLAEHTAEHRARELVEILRDTPPRTVREPLASVAET